MVKSRYDEQILDVLHLEGGKVEGFNTLKNLGIAIRGGTPFHGNELKLAIERLEKKGLIKVNTIGNRGEKEYLLVDQNIEKAYKSFSKQMQEMENQLYKPNLKKDEKRLFHHNYMILALHNLNLLRFFRYASESYKRQGKPMSLKKIEGLEAKLEKDIQNKLDTLDEDERDRILNLMMPKEPNLLTLEDYRSWTHKPTEKEKRAEKLMLKQRQIEDHKISPFCRNCGKKTKDYTDKGKHIDRHMEELFTKGLAWVYKKYGSEYNENTGKQLPRDKKLEKDLLRMQSKEK